MRFLLQYLQILCLIVPLANVVMGVYVNFSGPKTYDDTTRAIEAFLALTLLQAGSMDIETLPTQLSSASKLQDSGQIPARGLHFISSSGQEFWFACTFGSDKKAWFIFPDDASEPEHIQTIEIHEGTRGRSDFLDICLGQKV